MTEQTQTDLTEKKRIYTRRNAVAQNPNGQKPSGQLESSLPPEERRINAKIIRVTKSIKKLSKNESSSGADSYSYVSIDQYYEQVALKLAESEGLGWGISEVPDMEHRFHDVYQDLHIRKVFRIVLFTEDGDSMDGGNLTVTMPYEGATTTGKMLSYADKAFMRQLFKIPTDEPEAENSKEVKKSEAGSQKNAKDKDSFFSGKGES